VAPLQDGTLRLNAVIPRMKVNSRKQVLARLSEEIAASTGLDQEYLLRKLLFREQAETSAVGNGVAIPHLYMKNLESPFTMFARLDQPVGFGAPDGAPVDLVFLVMSPDTDGPLHLRRLARVSRLLRDEALRTHLRGTDDADTLYSLLHDPVYRMLAA
jgi:nitrogen PTS system EIIA component